MLLKYLIEKFFGQKGVYVYIILVFILIYIFGMDWQLFYSVMIILVYFILYKAYARFVLNKLIHNFINEEGLLIRLIQRGIIKRWMLVGLFFILILMPWNWLWLFLIIINYNWWMFLVWLNGNKDIFFKKYFNWDCRPFFDDSFFFYYKLYAFSFYNEWYSFNISKIMKWLIWYPIYRIYWVILCVRVSILKTDIKELIKGRLHLFLMLYLIISMSVFIFYLIPWYVPSGSGFLLYKVITYILGGGKITLMIIIYIDIGVILPIIFYFFYKATKEKFFLVYVYPSRSINCTYWQDVLKSSMDESVTFQCAKYIMLICNRYYKGYMFKKYNLVNYIVPVQMQFILFGFKISIKINSFNKIYEGHVDFIRWEKCYGQSNYGLLLFYLDCDAFMQNSLYSFNVLSKYGVFTNSNDKYDVLNNFDGYGLRMYYVYMFLIAVNLEIILSINMNYKVVQKRLPSFKNQSLFWKIVLKNRKFFPYDRIPTEFQSNKTYKNYLEILSYLNIDLMYITWNESLNYLHNELLCGSNDLRAYPFSDDKRIEYFENEDLYYASTVLWNSTHDEYEETLKKIIKFYENGANDRFLQYRYSKIIFVKLFEVDWTQYKSPKDIERLDKMLSNLIHRSQIIKHWKNNNLSEEVYKKKLDQLVKDIHLKDK